jgi:Silencing defective 2 N-terminal ubiquitin domain
MSSRKKRSAEAQNGSNRNLDGRRLRTITEAKNLATYLATKPEMDRREKEERRKRWEAVVGAAERREEEIKSGKKGKGLSEEWVVEKEEVGEGVRDAVKRAMMAGKEVEKDEGGSGSGSGASREASEDDSEDDAMELDDEDVKRLEEEAAAGDVDAIWVLKNKVTTTGNAANKPLERRYAGFDEDDEFLSSDEEVDTSLAKGKAKAEA